MSKPRKTRGILGVLKSARPMLFTFQRKEVSEWPSEDSDSDFEPSPEDDSDFEPADEKAPVKEKSHKRTHKTNKRKRHQGEASTSQRQSTDSSDTTDDTVETSRKRQRRGSLDGEGNSQLKHKKKKKKKERRDSEKSGESNQKASTQSDGDETWSVRIPLLALERIFSFVIEGVGAVPLLCRLSRVCRLWKQAASQPKLWQHVDLANGRVKMTDRTVQLLAATRLTKLREISFSGWTKLSDKGLQSLVESCPHLEQINLTRCTSVSSIGLKLLVEKCHSLKAINLSMLESSDVVSPAILQELLKLLGNRLEHLFLNENMLRGCPIIMKAISTQCRQLKTLDLSNCRFSTDFLGLPIEGLQTGCPGLMILRLAGCRIRTQQATSKAQAESPGFVHLSELSLAVNTDTPINVSIGIQDQFLTRIMKNSRNLKLLDLRGLTHISAKGVEALTVDHLEHLYISQCSLSKYEGIEIVVQKWRHSLVELDLSWNVFPAMSLDVAMKKLSSGPSQSVLKNLNLSGTSITEDRVRSILQGCPNLVSLNLTSCRGLPRGMKRLHEKDDLKKLCQQLGVTQNR